MHARWTETLWQQQCACPAAHQPGWAPCPSWGSMHSSSGRALRSAASIRRSSEDPPTHELVRRRCQRGLQMPTWQGLLPAETRHLHRQVYLPAPDALPDAWLSPSAPNRRGHCPHLSLQHMRGRLHCGVSSKAIGQARSSVEPHHCQEVLEHNPQPNSSNTGRKAKRGLV